MWPGCRLHERALWDVIYTTGTTGEPTPVYNTTHDYHAYLFQSRRVAEISGIRETRRDREPVPADAGADGRVRPLGGERLRRRRRHLCGPSRCAARRFDVQRTLDEGLVRLIERHRATVLWGVPSFVRRTLLRAGELSADCTSLRMCVISGETSTPAMRDELRRCMRASAPAAPPSSIATDRRSWAHSRNACEDGDWHNPAPGDPVPRGRRSADRPPAARRRARDARRDPPRSPRHRAAALRRGRRSGPRRAPRVPPAGEPRSA